MRTNPFTKENASFVFINYSTTHPVNYIIHSRSHPWENNEAANIVQSKLQGSTVLYVTYASTKNKFKELLCNTEALHKSTIPLYFYNIFYIVIADRKPA